MIQDIIEEVVPGCGFSTARWPRRRRPPCSSNSPFSSSDADDHIDNVLCDLKEASRRGLSCRHGPSTLASFYTGKPIRSLADLREHKMRRSPRCTRPCTKPSGCRPWHCPDRGSRCAESRYCRWLRQHLALRAGLWLVRATALHPQPPHLPAGRDHLLAGVLREPPADLQKVVIGDRMADQKVTIGRTNLEELLETSAPSA